jgi:hypothetical protein
MRKITFVLCILCVALGSFLSACGNQPVSWKKIKETDRFHDITLSDKYGLFLGDSTNSHKIYHYPDKTISNLESYITIDYREQFRTSCFLQNDFWFLTDSLRIVEYSLITKTITEYPQIDQLGSVSDCNVSDNGGSLIVWGQHWVATHTLEWAIYSLPNIMVKHVAQDVDNKLWVLSDKNEIFYKDKDDAKWVLWGALQSKGRAGRIWKIGQSIFVSVTTDGVYRWVMGSVSPEKILKFEPKSQGITYDVITDITKDRNGDVLIMGINKLWILKQNIATQIELPESGVSILAYDKEQNGIYATNPVDKGGLYYLDLSIYNKNP